MALTLFLFKVSNLNISKSKVDINDEDDDQMTAETTSTQMVNDENITLLSAKVTFRGIYSFKKKEINHHVPLRRLACSFRVN